MRKLKIYFIHNSYTWYREPFFIELSKLGNLKYFFTKLWKNGYNEVEYDCYNIGELNHEVIKNTFHIAFPVFRHLLLEDYDVVLVTAMDTWHQTIEAFISAAIAKIRKKKVVYFWEAWDMGWLACEKRNLSTNEISHLQYFWRVRKFYVRRIYFRMLGKMVDRCIAVGIKSKEYFIKCGIPQEKICLAHDSSIIMNETVKQKADIGMSPKKITILYLHRMIKLKGGEQLLRAFAKLEEKYDNIELFMCGAGEYLTTLQCLAGELKLKNVVFTGGIAPKDRADYYKNCDIFVMPNYDPDVWGMAINEAMQFGKPIVVSDLTGCGPDLVRRGENGFIFRNGDTEQLFQCLSQLVKNESLRIKAGKLSADIISEYSYQQMAKDFFYAFEN